jgi:hypothetical protein
MPAVHKQIIYHQGAHLRQLLRPFYMADHGETMSDKSIIGRRPGSNPASARVIVADPRLKADQKAHARYRALVTIAGFSVLATLGLSLAKTTNYPTPSQTINAEIGDELFTGTIRTNPDDQRGCREQFFDNRIGKMTQPEPCGLRALNLRALNGNGAPAPSNSIEAIRKSFSSR